MRNHPGERARQIAAVERAGHDPALGTWPGDPGGPSAEARLRDEPEGDLPPDVTTPPARRVVEIDESGREILRVAVDPIVLENEARAADLNADMLLAQADRARVEAERLRDLAATAQGGTLTRCPVCGAGDSDCITDGCGIDLGELGERFTAEALLEALAHRADFLYDLAADIEAQGDSHAERVEVLREREARLRSMADGLALSE